MKKKILAVFLSLCMVMSLVPMTALAAEESWEEVSTAEGLSSALGAGGNIKLTEDITVTGAQAWTVGNGVNVVLDLNNHTISSSYAAISNYIMVINGGSLTVTDNSAEKGGKIEATDSSYGYGIQLKGNNSSFSLLSGTITTTQETVDIPSSASGCSIAISGGRLISTDDSVLCVRGSDTKVNITGGDLESEGRTGVYISNYGDPDSIVFNMTGGKLTHASGMSGAIQLYKGATLTIGGTAEITSASSYAVQVQENTILNVQGGTVSSERCAISVSNESAVNVSGGKISTEKASTTSGAIKAEDNATVVITGGSISAAGNAIYADGSSQMNISGESTAISAGENYQSVKKSGEEAKISITGGRFTVGEIADNSVSNYIPSGMEQASDGSVVIDTETAVAAVNGVGYTTLAAAVAAAEDGDTITMLKEYDATSEGTITFNADKDVTLDLGGFELTLSRFDLVQGRLTVKNGSVASNPTNGQAFNVYAGPDATGELYTKLVIEDDVTINAAYGICLFPEPNSNAGYNSSIEVYGKIESGGIFVSGNLGNDTNTAGDMASSNKIPTITIHEGAVVSNGTEGQGIAMNGLANVTVNGGTVSGSEAIGVKRGTLTVNGGTFLSNGEYVNPAEANNNGTENTGATISITSTYNYAGTINVNLNGGTFNSENAPAVYQGHSKSGETTKPYTQGVTLNIQGGTFTSPANVATVYVADEAAGDAESYTKQVISGGSFNESVAQYVTSDLKYEANANGTYTYHETLDEALAFSNNVSSVEAAKPGATVVTVTVKNGNDVDTIKLTSGTEYSLPDYPDQGYNHFVGWNDQAGNHYYGGQTVNITANTTFTAQWAYIPPANPNYRIDIPAAEGGTITADPAAAKAGATVTLTATPDEGYAVGTITVTDRFGDAVKVTENADGTYTFTMPNGQVTVNATFVQTEEPAPAEPFPDVDENDWFYDEVVYVYENGLMNGVENNQFAPNTATNRAMLATILYRLAGQPDVSGDLPFTDVAAGTWYTDAVLWAAQNGIVNGLGENTFAPMNTLTREQLVTMLYRYAEAEGYDVSAAADLSGYPDAGKVQTYAQEAMSWAVAEGIVEGMDGNLNPAGSATRAQIATILMRFCEGVAK